MMGIGGLMGLMFAYSLLFHVNLISVLILISLLGGILGWARLKREAHTPAQVYVGFVGGFFIVFSYMWFFVKAVLLGSI